MGIEAKEQVERMGDEDINFKRMSLFQNALEVRWKGDMEGRNQKEIKGKKRRVMIFDRSEHDCNLNEKELAEKEKDN